MLKIRKWWGRPSEKCLPGSQGLFDSFNDTSVLEWLFEEEEIELRVGDLEVFLSISGHEDDLRCWISIEYLSRHARTVHFRHLDVANNNINIPGDLGHDIKGVLAIDGLMNDKTGFPEGMGGK